MIADEGKYSIYLLKYVRLFLISQIGWRQSFDILFEILSDILSNILSDILFDILSNIISDILFDISSDIHSGTLSDILSDILFDILSDQRKFSWETSELRRFKNAKSQVQ